MDTGRFDRAARPQRPQRKAFIEGRTLWLLVGLVSLGGLAVLAVIFFAGRGTGTSRLLDHPDGAGVVVSYAGSFPLDADARLIGAAGIALDGDSLLVAESDGARLRRFSLAGEETDVLRLAVEGQDREVYPVDVAALPDGRLVVIDTASNQVLLVRIRALGDPVATVVEGPGDAGFALPTAVGVDGDEIYVADAARGVWHLGADLMPVRILGEGLEPPLTFVGAISITADLVYVADSNAGRVVAFDKESGALAGVVPERFRLARGIAVVPGPFVFVADTFAAQVSVFGPDGEEVTRFSGADVPQADAGSSLGRPQDLAYDPVSQRLFVSDAEGGRIVAFNVRLPDVESAD